MPGGFPFGLRLGCWARAAVGPASLSPSVAELVAVGVLWPSSLWSWAFPPWLGGPALSLGRCLCLIGLAAAAFWGYGSGVRRAFAVVSALPGVWVGLGCCRVGGLGFPSFGAPPVPSACLSPCARPRLVWAIRWPRRGTPLWGWKPGAALVEELCLTALGGGQCGLPRPLLMWPAVPFP